MKRFNRRLKAFLLSLLIALDIPLMGYTTALAADAATYRTGLAPLETLVAAVVIGSGIVVTQSQQAVNALVNSVCSIIKDNTVRKEEEDPAFESPYRVIQGGGSGSDPTPEEPNNNNKNGRWFGIVGASSLGSALLFEKGAVEEIIRTIQSQNGYSSTVSDVGIVSSDDFKIQSTSGQIALQLANLGDSALEQFNVFLNSNYWDSAPFEKNNCWYAVSCDVQNIISGAGLPDMFVTVMEKSDDVKFLRLMNRLTFYTYTANDGSLSFYGFLRNTTDADNPTFLSQSQSPVSIKQQTIRLRFRNPLAPLTYTVSSVTNSQNVLLNSVGDPTTSAYCGYKWVHANDWGFTNNVYNPNQTFNVNFPDWLQQSITLLGKQIDAVNLGLQNLSKINWAQTQQQIQTAPASEAAASQAVNNWENPGNIPEPEPNPNPDPDPEPNPEEEPAHEAAVTEGAESIYNWVTEKITLPAGIFEKIPFSIPYDLYLLLRSMFPTSNRVRKKAYFTVSNVQSRSSGTPVLDPNGITISSHFDAVAKNTKSYEINWKPAPVINLDLHFSYTDVGGQKKALDIVKSVDLQPYSYFAMIVYIGIYISWLIAVLGWIMESFK